MDENNILTGSNSNDEPPPCYTEVVGRVPGEHIDTSSIPACSSKESDERSHADTAGIEDNNKSNMTGTNIDCDNKTTPEANQENPNPTYNKPKAVLKRTPSVPIESIAVPKVNCPEKIILCIDHSTSMFLNHFRKTVQSIKQTSIFHVLSSAVRQFIMTKSFIDKQHEFSLFMLDDDAQLITDFSPQGGDVLYMLQDMADSSKTKHNEKNNADCNKYMDLTSLFDKLSEQISLPNVTNPSQFPPPYVVRVIIAYGRSDCKLEFCGSRESFQKLVKNPYFFIDCVYIHEDPAEDNSVMDAFTRLCELDANGTSHIFEVSVDGSMSALYNAFAKLLAHPLQRPLQGNPVNYEITSAEQLSG